MPKDIVELVGEKFGETSLILVGVHGNEKCGIEALDQILPTLKIKRGRVLFAKGNPRALKADTRFVEQNLNRMFIDTRDLSSEVKESYEYKRAQFLKKYLDQADVLLDIHASSISESKPFLICEKNAREITKYLPIKLAVSGFDEFEPGGTDYYMNKIGKIGICVECGYLGDPNSTELAKQSILEFLKIRGHIAGEVISRNQNNIQIYKKYSSKTNKFRLAKSFADFEVISNNQLIGTDGAEEIRAPEKSLILFAHNCDKTGEEAFLLARKNLV